jgi:N-acetylglutamate synthase-like GNAT family acetyltransferase
MSRTGYKMKVHIPTRFVRASEADLPSVHAMLAVARLPADAATHADVFTLARRGTKLVGCVGAEMYAESALLHSVAVDEGARGPARGVSLRSENPSKEVNGE